MIPSDWKTLPLSEAAVINPTVRLRKGEVYPFVDMNAIDPGWPTVRLSEERAFTGGGSRFQNGDMLFARITPCLENGKIARFQAEEGDARPAHGSTEFIVMRGRDGVSDTDFVSCLARSAHVRGFAIRQMTGSSGRQRVPVDCFDKLTVSVPPLDEQRAIASVLGALDDKIEQNRHTEQALEKLARAIFRAWFVDFEPVKAKAAGAANFPSMPQPVFDVLPARFVDSAVGPVPEGWEVGAIKDLATLSKTQVKPQEHPEEPFDHFSIPAFDAGMRAVVEPGSAIKSNKFLVVDGCVLLSKLNPRIARIWLPPSSSGKRQIASTEFLVFLPERATDRHYLYCQFEQREFRDELAQSASGTSNSHQRVRPDDVLKRPVALPPESIRRAFADIADPMFALASANHGESAKLADMRDDLLPRLLSGAVRVGQAEALAVAVA